MSSASSASITTNKQLDSSRWLNLLLPMALIGGLALSLISLLFYLSYQSLSNSLERDTQERLLVSASTMAQQVSANLQKSSLTCSTELAVNMDKLQPNLLRMIIPWGGAGLLLDGQGQLYALPTDLDEIANSLLEEFKQHLSLDLLRTEASGLISLQLNGDEVLLSWASVSNTNWKVLNLVKAERAFYFKQQLARDYLHLLGVGLFFLGGMFILLAIFTSRRDKHIVFATIPHQTNTTAAPLSCEQKTASLIELIDEPLMLCQFDAQGLIQQCNSAFERLTGKTLTHLKGQNYLSILGLNYLEPNSSNHEIELFAEQANNLFCWYGLYYYKQPNNDNQPNGEGLLMLLDISTYKFKQLSLEGDKNRARVAAKMRANFFQVAVNDANQLLLELLRNAKNLGTQLSGDYHGRLLELQYLLDNLRDMSESDYLEQEGAPDLLDVQAFIQECLASNGPLLEGKQRQLVTHLTPNLPTYLTIDRRRLVRLVSHLLRQIMQLSERGNIHLHLDYQASEAQLLIQIYDEGGGLDIQERLQRFQLTTPLSSDYTQNSSALGLGQILSRQLVQELKGQLTTQALQNGGLQLNLSLPAQPVSSTTSQQPLARILVVDDGPVNTLLASSILEKSDYKVDIANSGQQALELGQKHVYDLVLMDIFMPLMDGFETSRRWRELKGINAKVPIIALTANAEEINSQKLSHFGLNAYLIKPYKPNELRKLIETWLTP